MPRINFMQRLTFFAAFTTSTFNYLFTPKGGDDDDTLK